MYDIMYDIMILVERRLRQAASGGKLPLAAAVQQCLVLPVRMQQGLPDRWQHQT
jgi:Mg-chelatase subunit ChlD